MNIKGIRTIDDLFELLNVRESWYDCRMKDNTLDLRFKNKLNCRRKLVVKYDIITKEFYGYDGVIEKLIKNGKLIILMK